MDVNLGVCFVVQVNCFHSVACRKCLLTKASRVCTYIYIYIYMNDTFIIRNIFHLANCLSILLNQIMNDWSRGGGREMGRGRHVLSTVRKSDYRHIEPEML